MRFSTQKRGVRMVILLTAGALLLASPLRAQEPGFSGLGFLDGPAPRSLPLGVSPDGRFVVGNSRSQEGPEAFRWSAETGMIGLGDLPGGVYGSSGWAASFDGTTVVGDSWSANGTSEAFRWSESTGMIGLGDLPGGPFNSTAYDVSADGSVVVGRASQSTAPADAAFRWEDGVMEALPGLPGSDPISIAYAVSADGRIVAGRSEGPSGESEAVRWVDGVVESLGLPPGDRATSTAAYDMSADGRVVVGTVKVINPGGTESFIWREGEGMDYFPDFPGGSPFLQVFSISGDGRVVVGMGDGPNGFEAFIWTAQLGTRSLREFLSVDQGFDLTGWALGVVGPQGVSYDGTVIVGAGRNPDGIDEAWRAVLPPFPVANTPTEPPSPDGLHLTAAPNPVRGRATVRVQMPEAGPVQVAVYSVLGRRVATLQDGVLAAGTHRLAFEARDLPSGVYLVRAVSPSGVETTRLTVLN